jgi:hypothetical protein
MPSFAFLSPNSVEQNSLIFEFSSNTTEVNAIAGGMYRVFHLNKYSLLIYFSLLWDIY